MRAARYVVRNPVRAGLVEEAAAWQWSSYRATAGLADVPDWLRLDWIRLAFSRDSIEDARPEYVAYINGPTERHPPIDLDATVLGSERFTTRLLEHLMVEQLQHGQPPHARPRLAELFSEAESQVVRDRLIYLARVAHGYRLSQVARFLGIDRSTASKAASRGAQSNSVLVAPVE
jgi:hypothetical protein